LNSTVIMKRTGSGQVNPDLELSHLELVAGKDATTRDAQLPRLARAAFAAHQYTKAESYARECLEAARREDFWWKGDAIHQGNIVLGRLAVRRGDMQAASAYLISAGKTPGSSALDGLGPSMSLAHDLLMEGKWAPVIEYLEECKQFWAPGERKLAEWLALARANLMPDFGSNLDY
jgi:hypothetical protein